MFKKLISYLILSVALIFTLSCSKNGNRSGNSFSDITKGLERQNGFFDLYIDKSGGKIYARLPKPDEDGLSLRMIHANSLNAGLGSNPVGLDRGLTTGGQILAMRVIGGNVVAEAENWSYRASAEDPFEKQSVRDSFAKSYLWSGPIKARSGRGHILVDISSFLTLDLMNIRAALKQANQGKFEIAKERTFPQTSSALVFSDNVEIDAAITLTSDDPGNEVRSTASDGRSVTLSLHHSFVRLPDDGYKPRLYDPRTAAIPVPFYDFSTNLDEPVLRHYARRFRLEREAENVATGPVKKPIIFYVDRGAPEPVRSALIDGANWWAQAFAEAGFEDAFRVKILPEDAHPLDIRYNVIQWTHRQTRGWSYGGGISDPRTGEMLKAHVILGSQRVRQDRMIFEGLAGATATGSGSADDPVQIALSRIRQLSAHEVGHTLGFAHNFAASTIDKASVMDYPAPDIGISEDGGLDFSNAYATGIGTWDKFTVRWLYTQFARDTEEQESLNNIVNRGYQQGLRFVSDRHARSRATSHPHGSLWDNGKDPIDALEKVMKVRKIALRNFDLSVIADGTPRTRLQEVLVPVYLYHRYQVNAAAKLVGGYHFNYAVAGDGLSFSSPVPENQQLAAIETLLKTLEPSELDLPERILVRLSPPSDGFSSVGHRREIFGSHLGEVFDPLNASDAAVSITLGALLEPARLARMIESNRRDAKYPGIDILLAALNYQVFDKEFDKKYAAITRRTQTRFVSTLMTVAQNKNASPVVRTEIDGYLQSLQGTLSDGLSSDNNDPQSNHYSWLLSIISSHLNRDDIAASLVTGATKIPQGSPIGSGSPGNYFIDNAILETCWHCDSRL